MLSVRIKEKAARIRLLALDVDVPGLPVNFVH